MHLILSGCAIKTRKEALVDKKTFTLLVGLAITLVVCGTIIALNLLHRSKTYVTSSNLPYEPNKVFSITVSEETWDESMMPKGKRSPKGVLYNPEK